MPDNLSLDGDTLFVAGHPHFPTLAKFTETRHICNSAAELAAADVETKAYCADPKSNAPSWVAEWSEEKGLQTRYVGADYPSSSMATRDAKRKVGIITGLYAKGILVWRD